MKEDFLSYLWSFQKFKGQLFTTKGETITVIKQGFLNTNAGQDFSEARLVIADIEWAGNIELHIKSSDWNQHKHQLNKAYNNTVLHVVWEHDKDIKTEEHLSIPTLELKNIVDKTLLEKYHGLVNNLKKIPCKENLVKVNTLIQSNEVEKTLINRLERKGNEILALYENNKQNWQETTYQLLAKNFGFKINANPFLRLSEKLPLKLLQKHAHNPLQIEALLFGVSGFLNKKNDSEYFVKLDKEFNFLKHKYQLDTTGTLEDYEWKFMRLRPGNSPTTRLAQFGSFISQNNNPFSAFILSQSATHLLELFKIKTSEYWQTHYSFNSEQTKTGSFGKNSKENLLINTVAPLLTAYSIQKDDYQYREKAIRLLESLPPEKNKITTAMMKLGFENKDASQSQGLIELHNERCLLKKCLNCSIGTKVLAIQS